MKTLLFTLALTLSVMFSKANHALSQLNLKMFDNSNFTVVFDNMPYHTPSNTFNFANLSAGSHKLKVFRNNYGYNSHTGNQLVFNGFITIPAGTQLIAMIDFYNNFNIISQNPVFYTNYNGYSGNSGCSNNNGWGNFNGYNGYTNYNTYNAGYAPAAPVCISNQSFNYLVNTINNASFDSNKLQIAMQAISGSGVTSSQVLTIMNLLTFESNKLSLAKQAYQYTIDKGNYYIVNNGFTFSSSINDLNNYVNRF